MQVSRPRGGRLRAARTSPKRRNAPKRLDTRQNGVRSQMPRANMEFPVQAGAFLGNISHQNLREWRGTLYQIASIFCVTKLHVPTRRSGSWGFVEDPEDLGKHFQAEVCAAGRAPRVPCPRSRSRTPGSARRAAARTRRSGYARSRFAEKPGRLVGVAFQRPQLHH